MSWTELAMIVWGVVLLGGLGCILWQIVALARAWRRNGRETGQTPQG